MKTAAALILILLPSLALAQTTTTTTTQQENTNQSRQRQQQLNQNLQQQQQQLNQRFDQNNRNWQQQQQFQQDLQQQKRQDAVNIQRQQDQLDNPQPVIVAPASPYPYQGYQLQPPAQAPIPPAPGCRAMQPYYDANGNRLGDLCVH